ncbi:hypothetical protein GQ600_10641 [Phytophthora cactorum]|nr:hypothetical protein GQ600_10641 [Phytophthora cactorum]
MNPREKDSAFKLAAIPDQELHVLRSTGHQFEIILSPLVPLGSKYAMLMKTEWGYTRLVRMGSIARAQLGRYKLAQCVALIYLVPSRTAVAASPSSATELLDSTSRTMNCHLYESQFMVRNRLLGQHLLGRVDCCRVLGHRQGGVLALERLSTSLNVSQILGRGYGVVSWQLVEELLEIRREALGRVDGDVREHRGVAVLALVQVKVDVANLHLLNRLPGRSERPGATERSQPNHQFVLNGAVSSGAIIAGPVEARVPGDGRAVDAVKARALATRLVVVLPPQVVVDDVVVRLRGVPLTSEFLLGEGRRGSGSSSNDDRELHSCNT